MRLSTSCIQNQAFKKSKLNILTAPTHEAYETNLAKTGHNFYSVLHPSVKTWNEKYRRVPDNYFIYPLDKIPQTLNIDVVLSQNKFGQYQILSDIARKLHAPLISLEHTLPMPQWDARVRSQLESMRGNIDVFISNYSISQWMPNLSNSDTIKVVEHGIDTLEFESVIPMELRDNKVLCVVNDWINRDWCCNYQTFVRTIGDTPCKIVGNTPNLSVPATSTEELIMFYNQCRIFYNTSVISPVPTALMEAMACGCAVVSTATCMIPDIIKHGENGLISNNEDELREYLKVLSTDIELAKKLGENARKTICERFSLDRFVNNWNEVFAIAAGENGCL